MRHHYRERMKTIDFRNDILPLKDLLFRLALRITLDKAEAEDVVQETMVKVWNRRDSWAGIDSMEAFCMTICRNLALDKTRKAERRGLYVADSSTAAEPQDLSATANPEERAVQRNRMELVRGFVNSLPEKQRTAMQLRDFEGKSYKEVAAAMCISEEQVKVNIFRARQTIKKKLIETENYGL